MKNKIFYTILLVLICCGCSTKYTIEIDENLGVKEYARAVETSEFFEQYPNSSVERVIGFLIEPHLEYLNENNFKVSDINDNEEAGVGISNSYKSIKDYVEISKIYKQYGNLEYTETEDQITLKINGAFSNNEQDQSGKYLIDTSEISIKLPHNVVSHNADEVDEENGVYTWYINESGVKKELYITFDKKIKGKIPVEYIVGGILAVVLVIGIYSIYSKVKNSNNMRNEI